MATKKEMLVESQQAFGEFFELCTYLLGDDAPQDMNEIPSDSKFYPVAKDIAKEMKVDWEKMTHAESNSLMLNILADYWAQIAPVEGYKPMLTINFQKAE